MERILMPRKTRVSQLFYHMVIRTTLAARLDRMLFLYNIGPGGKFGAAKHR